MTANLKYIQKIFGIKFLLNIINMTKLNELIARFFIRHKYQDRSIICLIAFILFLK